MPSCPSVRPSVGTASIKVSLINLISQKDGQITVLLFWYGVSLGRYQSMYCTNMELNHLKGHFERSDR